MCATWTVWMRSFPPAWLGLPCSCHCSRRGFAQHRLQHMVKKNAKKLKAGSMFNKFRCRLYIYIVYIVWYLPVYARMVRWTVVLKNVQVTLSKRQGLCLKVFYIYILTAHVHFLSCYCSFHYAASLSEWSEWTSCSPCIPASSLQYLDEGTAVQPSVTGLVSVQRRYRTCLDLVSGLPISQRDEECSGPLMEERVCPQPGLCKGDSNVSITQKFWHHAGILGIANASVNTCTFSDFSMTLIVLYSI